MIDDARRVLLVERGIKPCFRMRCPTHELPGKLDFFRSRGLVVVEQQAAVNCLGPGDALYYVAATRAEAERPHTIEAMQVQQDGHAHGLDRAMGAALGYPSCCVDAFIGDPVHSHRDDETGSMFWRRLSDGGRYDARLNVIFPRFAGFIEHIPCSFDCAPSAALVQRAIDAIAEGAPGFPALFEACFHMDLDVAPSGQPLAYYRPGLEQRWVHLVAAATAGTERKRVRFSPRR